jgi:hypothetical protein
LHKGLKQRKSATNGSNDEEQREFKYQTADYFPKVLFLSSFLIIKEINLAVGNRTDAVPSGKKGLMWFTSLEFGNFQLVNDIGIFNLFFFRQ